MGKRGRSSHSVKDKYPEYIRTQITPVTPVAALNTTVSGAITAFTWEIPVELNLDHPVYIELEKLVAYVEHTVVTQAASVTVNGGDLQSQDIWDVVLLTEPRTTFPAEDDNAILAHWDLMETKVWANTSAASTNVGYNLSTGTLREERDYQDMTTGNGLLLTQPRLFLLAQRSTTIGDIIVVNGARPFNLKMQFRLVTDVTAREFMTEIVAAFN